MAFFYGVNKEVLPLKVCPWSVASGKGWMGDERRRERMDEWVNERRSHVAGKRALRTPSPAQ